ncbi:MAG TPA: hypothetical protein VHG53_07910 [Candidatus Limnocylindria bacterium]|nr:hypothetical protein [Candidatus Limnocylindria bacterium]
MPRKYAAQSKGVAERTIMLWLQLGRQAEACADAGCADPHHGPSGGELTYLQFLQSVLRAEADAGALAVGYIAKAMPKD